MCNPWNKQKFFQIMQNQIPKDQCRHCLPDCTTTRYETTMTYAELRKCDRTNIGGTSMLCALVDGKLNPAPWLGSAQKEFIDANQTMPGYLSTNSQSKLNITNFSNQRLKVPEEERKSNLMFPLLVEENPTYDAFKKDIGIVKIFFRDKKILKYVTNNRMTSFGFLSQIGGTLGLSMGISFISVIEIIYWFTYRLFK